MDIYHISGYEYDVFKVKDFNNHTNAEENDELWIKYRDVKKFLGKLHFAMALGNDDEAYYILEKALEVKGD